MIKNFTDKQAFSIGMIFYFEFLNYNLVDEN